MKRKYLFAVLCFCTVLASAQTVKERLQKASAGLLADPQMKHAILGLSIVKSETGEKIFEINPQTGLAPASCQKTITAATALEMLGTAYRYHTRVGYTGNIRQGVLEGDLYIIGSGDPSTGSWRYTVTREDRQLDSLVQWVQKAGIKKISGKLIGYTANWEQETLPGGWIWDDIGNYYGAGIAGLNWHENQYDLVLRSGKQAGDAVKILAMRPEPYGIRLESRLRSAAKGSGDNAYIYLPPQATTGYVQGSIPVGEEAFTISGSFPDPASQFLYSVQQKLQTAGITISGFVILPASIKPELKTVGEIISPPLDSLNYWFLHKSINLYGEALLKTLAYEQNGYGSADSGMAIVKRFWQKRGIDRSALQLIDGSGLSPQNRVTTDALVQVLQYARTRPWFAAYYDALPVFNNMKLKSGTVGGAKSFAGYNTARDGTSYTMAIIVNNYNGSAGEIVKKLFAVLDELR